MENIVIGSIVILVIAICEAIKQAGLDSRYIPLLSLILGVILTLLFNGVSFLSTIVGVILGLSSTGGYSVVKTSLLNK